MADNVQVKIQADAGDAKSSMQAASTSIQASLDSIRKALADFGAKNKEVANAALKSNSDLKASFAELKTTAGGAFSGLTEAVTKFKGVVGALGASLAGGLIGREAVSSLIELRDTVRGLQIVFGSTSDKATMMALQLKLAGIEAATFEAMAFKVGRTLMTQSDEFARLGVKTKDATGNLLPMDQMLQNIYKRMLDFKPGTDQMEFALSTVGRSAKDFAADMTALNAVQERAIKLQHDMGIEMGPERQAEIGRYKIEMRAFHATLDAIAEQIGEKMLPGLMRMAQFFNSYGPAAAEIFTKVIVGLLLTTDSLSTGVHIVYLNVKSYWDQIVLSTAGMVNAMRALFTDGWNAAARVVANANAAILRNQMETNAAILGLQADLAKRVAALSDTKGPETPGGPPTGKGTERFTFKPQAAGAGAAVDIVGPWRQQLEELKDAQGLFNEFSKAQEAAFWAEKLTQVQVGTKEYREVYHAMHEALRADAREQLASAMETFQLEIDQAKNSKDQQIQIAVTRTAFIKAIFGEESKEFKRVLDEETKLRQAWAQKDLEIVKLQAQAKLVAAKFDVEMGRAALDQDVALRRVNAEQKFAVEVALEDRLFILESNALKERLALLQSGTRDYQEVANQIEALEQAHQLKLTQIANAAELERKKDALAIYDSIESNFIGALSDAISGTKSLKDAFKNMAKSIEDDISRIAAKNIAKAIFGEGTSGGGALMSIIGSFFGGGGGAGIAAFAEGTPYVPSTGLALVHKGERIVSAAQNRSNVGGSGVVSNINFAIAGPMDTRSQAQIATYAAAGMRNAIAKVS